MFHEMMRGLLGPKQQTAGDLVLLCENSVPANRTKMGSFLLPALCTLASLIAFAALPALSAGLNDTGITTCGSSRTTTENNCANVSADDGSFPRQDARYGRDAQAGVSQLTKIGDGGKGFDFSKIADDGSVLSPKAHDWTCTMDNRTGLLWEIKTSSGLRDASHVYTWYQTSNTGTVGVKSGGTCQTAGRCDTEKFVADVNAAGLCGSSDWRMPTIKELESIVDFGYIDPTIDPDFFPNTKITYFWTSSMDASLPGQYAWFLDFMEGSVRRNELGVPLSVRLVRGAPTQSQFSVTGATVTDASTGLMWKRDYEMRNPAHPGDWLNRIDTFAWQEALQRAVVDTTGGYTDWRVPNVKELRSLIDETRFSPAISTNAFPPTPFQGWFWSSSPYLDYFRNTDMSWVVSFDYGVDQGNPRVASQYVRLVRGGDSFDNLNAAAVFSPSSLTFAAQNIGTSSTAQTIALTNSGGATLNISSIAASGDYARTTTCGATLEQGASCSISVTFTPTAAGTRSGTITITSNATGSPHSVSLTGTGVGVPTVSLSPTALTFASLSLSTTSAAQVITLRNIGTGALNISSIAVSVDYARTTTCGATLEQGASCSISVTFTPTAAGTRSGTITITSNATGSPHSVSLSGTGVAAVPALSLNPTLLTFAAQNIGASSTEQTIKLTNSGGTALNISIAASGDFTQSNNCADGLGVAGFCSLNVTFTPTAAGTRTGAITVTSNAVGSPHSVSLSGTGVLTPPTCTLTASPVVISAGNSSTLTASCTPAATSYIWTNSGFAATASEGKVSPTTPTNYTVVGSNEGGSGNVASAAVYVCNTAPSQLYAGQTLTGTGASESFHSGIGSDTIDGVAGVDTVIYNCNRISFTLVKTASGWSVVSSAEGVDRLTNIERIQFPNETLALDISGNAGQAYRIYQAAFNRTPDNAGLKYWIGAMDNGASLNDVAAGFINSNEFQTVYGTNPTNPEFVTKLYSNVLHRAPDQSGFDYWSGLLNTNQISRVQTLVNFSESPENQAGVIGAILNGIDLLN